MQVLTEADQSQAAKISHRFAAFNFEALLEPSPDAVSEDTTSSTTVLEQRARAANAIVKDLAYGGTLSPSISRYHLEQEFEGVVLDVDSMSDTFVARLIDMTNPNPDEEAEISFEEISKDDHSLIVPGAIFTWAMGRSVRAGQTTRNSEIRFRRVFRFTEDSIKRAEKQAEKLFDLLSDADQL